MGVARQQDAQKLRGRYFEGKPLLRKARKLGLLGFHFSKHRRLDLRVMVHRRFGKDLRLIQVELVSLQGRALLDQQLLGRLVGLVLEFQSDRFLLLGLQGK
jgi:hypothetical protein